ncbi:hypothetical protein Q4554_15200 [Leptospira santarosai]|uniref:hypothetical protein n=1 Tax=Leptospira santarosai TaxID=28183 RepID=UPI0026E19A3B|nr:hypothetical protein [Leptospira santarosai]MDO6395423.1 hypothetical protein [Leptospira santarosai]
MNAFTMDNTQGFSQTILDKMNAEYEVRIAEYNENEIDSLTYDSICKNLADEICNKY